MKNTKRIVLLFLALIVVGGGMTGCAKAYEDECIEIIRRPQIDLEPQPPGWDDGGTDTIE